MATLYVNRRATSIHREGQHLVVKQRGMGSAVNVQTVPLHEVTGVVVVGEPSITFPALSCFIQRQIPVSFLSVGGSWRGCIDTASDNYGERRRKQYQLASEQARFLEIAKAILSAKLYNARRLLQRLSANRRPHVSWTSPEDLQHVHQLQWIATHLHQCASPNALRGMEGLGAVHYFSLLSTFFPPDAAFQGRRRHPAKDPANALLSWAYSLLLSELIASVRHHGLDPAMGVLHVNANRSPALALDLIEPFRPCADRLTLNLLTRHIIHPQTHFKRLPSGAVMLNDEGRSRVFSAYETMLSRTFVSPNTGKQTTLRESLHQQVLHYLHFLEDQTATVTSFFKIP
ncbi:MAG: CRISPR-associated endonuclease Cas1 [Kiritimatiellae bacterium]|nr:CRISPR-associated endonuclease Cas1 [Kiritimatiellia bacterium]